MDSLEFAIAAFDTTASLTDGELGAEATYYKAMVFYRLDSLELSEAEVYNLVNRVPSYQFWVAKGLILLSDIYVRMDDNFQAKATLQSIIDNYDGGGGLVEEAMKKIDNAPRDVFTEFMNEIQEEVKKGGCDCCNGPE